MTDSPRISRLLAAVAAGDAGAAATFWADVTSAGTPMVEPDGDKDLVTFLRRGRAREMNLALRNTTLGEATAGRARCTRPSDSCPSTRRS